MSDIRSFGCTLCYKVTKNLNTLMIYGYIRVSSDKQTVENQRFEINKFCEREKLTHSS